MQPVTEYFRDSQIQVQWKGYSVKQNKKRKVKKWNKQITVKKNKYKYNNW